MRQVLLEVVARGGFGQPVATGRAQSRNFGDYRMIRMRESSRAPIRMMPFSKAGYVLS
jgi:hypothetical protein